MDGLSLFVQQEMNLKEAILKEHSKRQTIKIVRWVGEDKKRFNELMNLFLTGEDIVKQRSAWAFSYSAIAHPLLVKPHLKKLLENLKTPGLHDAVKRNTLRLLQEINIPEDLQGLATEICFTSLTSVQEPIAVKCFAMTTAANICKQHPELARELKMLVEDMLPHASAGVKSRIKRTLKQLSLA